VDMVELEEEVTPDRVCGTRSCSRTIHETDLEGCR
jgi:hypothetical protein